jgi:hypothetical protein
MSDSSFLREVDEAVRHERYKKLWDRYGIYAIGLGVLIIAGVSGYKGLNYWRERVAGESGAEFTQALVLEQAGDKAKAKEAFGKLVEEGPAGYQVLARFQLAEAEAKSGQIDKAVAHYDALATDARVDGILKGFATIKAAMLKVDSADYAEMERRVGRLIEQNSPWRYSARDLLGLTAYRLNNMNEAERQFSALLGDPGTPTNLRQRADMMLALIAGDPKAMSTTAN